MGAVCSKEINNEKNYIMAFQGWNQLEARQTFPLLYGLSIDMQL
jgi:hypothetical protein